MKFVTKRILFGRKNSVVLSSLIVVLLSPVLAVLLVGLFFNGSNFAGAVTTISSDVVTGGNLQASSTLMVTGAFLTYGNSTFGNAATDINLFTGTLQASTTALFTDGLLTYGNSTFGNAATDINLFTGTLQASTTALFTEGLTTYGNSTFGNAVADVGILNGRIATGSANGTALTLDSTYTWGEGQELRYKVTDWTNVGGSFRGLYVRAENGIDASTKGVYGAELYATALDTFDTGTLQGLLSYAYLKGTGAKTVGPAYGVHGELSFDAGQSTQTITTEASAGFFRITGGVADDFTKLHGVIVRAGDMDGASRTYGNAILVEDGPEAGTITWTRGLKLNAPSTIDIELQNAETISNATDGNVFINTTGLSVATSTATTTRSLFVSAPAGTATTTISLSGAQGSRGSCLELYQENVSYRLYIVASSTDISSNGFILQIEPGSCRD